MSSTATAVSGLFNIDKPQGLTSHDVVARVRKVTGQRKVGHTGTLDPLATGVLLLCLGQATRLIEYLMPSHKQYRATIRFGIATDTLDAEGQVTARSDIDSLTAPQLRQNLPTFTGQIQQIPPAFSAIKRGGQPLYKLARAGEAVEVEPRPVTIYNLTWLDWSPPDLTVDVTCSAGTYIRSLARDLGQMVGTGAHLAGLVRTAVGPWPLAQAVPLDVLVEAAGRPADWQQYLYPPDRAVAHLPKISLDQTATEYVKHGRPVQLDPAQVALSSQTGQTPVEPIRAYGADGTFLAILKVADDQNNIWQPKKVFQTP